MDNFKEMMNAALDEYFGTTEDDIIDEEVVFSHDINKEKARRHRKETIRVTNNRLSKMARWDYLNWGRKPRKNDASGALRGALRTHGLAYSSTGYQWDYATGQPKVVRMKQAMDARLKDYLRGTDKSNVVCTAEESAEESGLDGLKDWDYIVDDNGFCHYIDRYGEIHYHNGYPWSHEDEEDEDLYDTGYGYDYDYDDWDEYDYDYPDEGIAI